MGPQKFVVRLLDDAGTLLSWAEVYASPKPQARPAASCPFFAAVPTLFRIDQSGVASRISVHWCDLDVARVQYVLEPVAVEVGQVLSFSWIEPVWLVPGSRDVPLPPVTVRAPVAIGVPTGALASRGL